MGVMPVVTIALVTAIISGSLSAAAVANLLRPTSSGSLNEATGSAASQVHLDESSAVITAVARVMPSVVVIQSSSSGGVLGARLGSGFIFDSNGWILTNKHVVNGADQISVQLNDSRIFTGRVYGIDTLTDLAIVKIDATGLPVAARSARAMTCSSASWRSPSAIRSAPSRTRSPPGSSRGSVGRFEPVTRWAARRSS